MKDYRDVWVVLRIDGPAQGYTDYVSVKGVYGSQAEAQAAADHATEVNAPPETQYHIFKKKQLISEDDQLPSRNEGSVQGLRRHLLEAWRAPITHPQWFSRLRELAASVPPEMRAQTFAPLARYLAEQLVAFAMHGRINSDPKSHIDLLLEDGRTVDVKAVVLSPDAKRAPFVMLQRPVTDLVALVLFAPDLDTASGFVMPGTLLLRYARGTSTRKNTIGVRVTPDLLDSPGVQRLALPNTETPRQSPNER